MAASANILEQKNIAPRETPAFAVTGRYFQLTCHHGDAAGRIGRFEIREMAGLGLPNLPIIDGHRPFLAGLIGGFDRAEIRLPLIVDIQA
jgi:hypothetical protein